MALCSKSLLSAIGARVLRTRQRRDSGHSPRYDGPLFVTKHLEPMHATLKPILLAVLLAGCSSPVEPATVPAVAPFQPADLPKTPASKATQDELRPGTWVEILDLGEKDPFFQTKAKLVGRRCVVWGNGLEGDEGLYRGTVRCDRGADFFLTQAIVGVLQEGNIGPQSQPGKVAQT